MVNNNKTGDCLYNTYFTKYRFYERQSGALYHSFRSLGLSKYVLNAARSSVFSINFPYPLFSLR